jgi:hypothetical protein
MSIRTRSAHLGPSVGSYGWPGYHRTHLVRRSRKDTTAVLTMQRAHPSDQRLPRPHNFRTAVYHATDE